MGRKEVEEVLERNPGVWYSIEDIRKETGYGYASVCKSFAILAGTDFVECNVRTDGLGKGKRMLRMPLEDEVSYQIEMNV